MKRREFLQAGAVLGIAATTSFTALANDGKPYSDPFKQPELPYALDALKPFLTEEQMSYHYGKHHAAYFANLKKLLEGKDEAKLCLEDIVAKAEPGPIFNNAAQAWNHSFFWNCMAPSGKEGTLGKELFDAIQSSFGSVDKFKEQFVAKAVSLFGSGWCWLASDGNGKLEIMPLSNADCPQKHDRTPLLVVDVWEHAYYVDYRNDRAKFVKAFMDRINWDFVSGNYS